MSDEMNKFYSSSVALSLREWSSGQKVASWL